MFRLDSIYMNVCTRYFVTHVTMFRAFVRTIWAIDNRVAYKCNSDTCGALVALPSTIGTAIDCSLADDAHCFFRLTVMDTPSVKRDMKTLVESLTPYEALF